MARTPSVAVLLLGLAAGAAGAQERPSAPTRDSGSIDVNQLGLNLERIQRELRQAITVSEEQDGLNLRYQIEVYGRAPEIQLFTPDDNLTTGPVPYGAPTHREIVDHITPQEFRSPVMDFNSLFRWLAEKTKK
jgi:hypothetical protein